MIAALLMAIAPQWFTSANPLEDPRRRARAAGALLAGYRPAGARPVDAGGLRRGAFPSAALIAVAIGPVVGTAHLAGALAGRVESTIMRLVDVLLAILPAAAAHGDYSAGFRHGKCGGGGWHRGYRQLRPARAEVVRVRHSDYVEAARGSGGTFFAVFWRHILPNSLTAVLAFATLQFGRAMLAPATLSFLGYGTPPPVPEWGLRSPKVAITCQPPGG